MGKQKISQRGQIKQYGPVIFEIPPQLSFVISKHLLKPYPEACLVYMMFSRQHSGRSGSLQRQEDSVVGLMNFTEFLKLFAFQKIHYPQWLRRIGGEYWATLV
jgi:hypothetical protein